MTSHYQRRQHKAPRLSGLGLRVLVLAVESRLLSWLIVPKLLKDNGFHALTQCALDCGPTVRPPFAVLSALADEKPCLALPEGESSSPLHSATDYRRAYLNGNTKPGDVAERYLDALRTLDESSLPLRAMVAVNAEDVLKNADESNARYEEGTSLGPLDGVLVAIKDEFHQIGYPTTGGTNFLGSMVCVEDATAVSRLREAGAVLVGKANMHEIGIGVTGLNPHHGTPRNPYSLTHHTGGSSSGCAAAVASGLVPIALSADGGGSIRIPAALCGVFGLKPTFGRVSEHGAIPLCWSVAHIGPIAANAWDLVHAYTAIAGPDPLDPNSIGQPSLDLSEVGVGNLDGLKIGVDDAWFRDADREVVAACRDHLDRLEKAGAEVVSIMIQHLELARLAHLATIMSEMFAAMGPELERDRRAFSLDTRMNMAIARHISNRDYVNAQRVRAQMLDIMTEIFEQVDMVATPTTGQTAPLINTAALTSTESNIEVTSKIMRFSGLANLTGIPAVSVPCGYDSNGLPVGLQLMAKPWRESVLLRTATVSDTVFERRRPEAWVDVNP